MTDEATGDVYWQGVMVDVTYHDGAGYLPSDAEVKTQRPQN